MLFNFINLLLAIIPLISLALSSPTEGSLPSRELETPFKWQDATANKVLPRKDREPGDVLKRTLCFCQTPGFSSEQVDGYPTYFKNLTDDSILGYAFTMDYYNLRLNITVTTEGKAWCASHGDDSNIGFYNECLDWKRLERKLCTKWRFTEQPEGIEQKDWEFCFQFWGMDKTRNGFDVHEIQDFSFDGATRNLPWHEDYYAPKEVMDDTCSKLCFNKLSHMQRFDSKKGGDFSQITSYHHFDDICIKHMACDKGPKA